MFLCTCVALAPRAMAQAGGFRIAGKVVSSISGAPLSQALVTIANVQDRNETKSLLTGDDGAFVFTNLAAGKYSLEGARRGFITSAYDAHENYSTAIVTGGEADSEHLVFRLTPQAVLTGRVLDEAGDPVRRASVNLYRQDQSTGVSRIGRMSTARTDDRGTYELAELPAGTYFVSVNAKPWYAIHPSSTPKLDGTVESPDVLPSFDVTYATTYYPDALDSDDAVPIPLRGGERLSIDMHLSPVPALRIIVRMPGGADRGFSVPELLKKSFDTTENIMNVLLDRGPDPTEDRGRNNYFTMQSPGVMEISGVPAGKYTVRMHGAQTSGLIADFDISQDGQEINPSAGEPVSGAKFTVQVLGAPGPPQGLIVALKNQEHKVVRSAPVDPKGEVELVDIPPGKYEVLSATRSNDYAVIRITTNGSTSKGHTLEIPAGSTIEGTVTLVGGQTVVQGFAKRAGKGVPGAMIVMVSKDPEAHGELFRRDQSDLDGSFSLGTVIPDEYTIVAIENGWDLNWSQPGVIAHYTEKGRKVIVAPTAQEPVRLSEPVEVQAR